MQERKRLLIEDWLPIAEVGEESMRERRSMTALPPTYYLHVWFARRPLVASRAAILGSLLPADYDREKFLHLLGIHGDPVATRRRIAEANARGERLETDVYGYPRAFQYAPEIDELPTNGSVLDPTAGGGSIPFEAVRLNCTTIANDLNPVAALLLRCTVEFPLKFGTMLVERYHQLALEFRKRAELCFAGIFPPEAANVTNVDGYLWARTITCPYCSGIVPLSPNWKLSSDGKGVRLVAEEDGGVRRIRFEMVDSAKEHSPGTVKGGDGLCPFPDCGRTIDGDDVKKQAQEGCMGHQLYCVVYKEQRIKGYTKDGRPKYEKVRGFRAPRPEDDVDALVRKKLAEKMPVWQARNIIPDEEYPDNTNDNRPINYGMPLWRDFFNPRQLFGHCTSVEVFHDMVQEFGKTDLDRAALGYIPLALDKMLNYNAIQVRWHSNREVVAGVFDRHDFSFKWSYAEMAPTITGLGYDWAMEQTGKALSELVELLGQQSPESGTFDFSESRPKPDVCITCRSADHLSLQSASVDCIVMDPPYYQNVMYAELSDFFYVWLKRTAGLLYPDLFQLHLTDKDREAVANLARFTGQKGGAKNLAKVDYQNRMAAIFKEQRRVLKPNGVMTVMFTHKEADAWDALAKGLIEAGFIITASWPVNTEAEGSLHIREKSAARSTIFLVCRARAEEQTHSEDRYWEEIEPQVRQAVRNKVTQFQQAGIGGIDLYLACFGPALQVFTEAWPLTRAKPRPEPKGKQKSLLEKFDPYAATPEDALEAARREVKDWRFRQLATIPRQHHLDPLTEWYVLAWDAFRAPRFPADEGLKLARVVGLDFDQDVKRVVCEVKGEDVLLWDSKTRFASGKLGHVGDTCMLDTLHQAARVAREQNTGAARNMLESAKLLDDPTLLTALEALLNVLPPGLIARGKKKPDALLSGAASDFEALENLRRLAFAEAVPAPKVPEQLALAVSDSDEDGEDDDAA
jgi:adenine-specific DNA methylase